METGVLKTTQLKLITDRNFNKINSLTAKLDNKI